MTVDWIGWIATAVFVASYLCKNPMTLRRVQALGAGLWVTYGVIIHATPVVVANLLVAGIAIYSSLISPKLAVSPPKDPATHPTL